MHMGTLVNRLKAFLRFDRATQCVYIEAFLQLARARYLVWRPFAKVAPSLGEAMKETSHDLNGVSRAELARIHDAIQTISQYTPWESKCLVCAIAALKMLEKRKIESTLYLGTTKEEGQLIAHAWLRSGPYVITGEEGMERFTVVGKFAKTISM